MQVIAYEAGNGDSLSQVLAATRNQSIAYVVPYLMVQGAPGGSVYVQMQDENGGKIVDSGTISIATIADSNEVFHGWYAFGISASVRSGLSYRFELKTSGGYSYGASDFVAWCNAWELKNRYFPSYALAWGALAPLGLDIWERRYFQKGEF